LKLKEAKSGGETGENGAAGGDFERFPKILNDLPMHDKCIYQA